MDIRSLIQSQQTLRLLFQLAFPRQSRLLIRHQRSSCIELAAEDTSSSSGLGCLEGWEARTTLQKKVLSGVFARRVLYDETPVKRARPTESEGDGGGTYPFRKALTRKQFTEKPP